MDGEHHQKELVVAKRRDTRRGFRQNVRRFLVALLVLPVAVVIAGLLILQIDGVATSVVNRLAARYSPWPGTSLAVENASMRGLGGLVFLKIRLTAADGSKMASVDTAIINFRALALLRGAIIIDQARIVGADVTARQKPDSAWDVLDPFTHEPSESQESREIRINDAVIVRSRVEAHYLAAADSVLRIESLHAVLPAFQTRGGLRFQLDTLGALVYPPSRPASPATVNGRMTLADGVLTAAGVRIISDSSNVSANGRLLLPTRDMRDVSDIDFRIVAEPLDFRDISAFVPGFDVPGSLRAEAHVTGTSRAMEFTANGRTFDGATVNASGRINRNPGDSVRYVIAAVVRGVDPQLWSAKAPKSRVDADLEVTLAGASPETVNGKVFLKVGRTELRGVIILPSTINAHFDKGTAYFTVTGGVAPWAEIDGSGKARPFDTHISAEFTGNARQLNDTTFGSVRIAGLKGFVHASWHDTQLDGRAAIAEGRIGNMPLDTANATVHYQRESTAFTATASADAGHIAVDALVSNEASVPTWTVNMLKVRDLNLARIDTTLPQTTLHGTARGSGRGSDVATMLATADVNMARSTIGTEVVDTAAFVAELRDGTLELRGMADAPRGHATFVASATPFAETFAFRLNPVRFSDLVLDTTASGRRVVLAGLLRADGILPYDDFPRITGTLDIDPTRINDGRLIGGHATFSMIDDGAHADAKLRTGDGTIDIRGSAQLARSGIRGLRIARGHAEGTVHLPDLDDLLGSDSADAGFDAQFAVDADGTNPETMAWAAQMSAHGKYSTAIVDTLTLRARLAGGIFRLDTLLLRSNVATGDGAGELAIDEHATPPDNARLHVRIKADSVYAIDQLLPFHNFSLRGGNLTLDATNSGGGIDATSRLTILGLISPGAWADSVQIDGMARLEQMTLTSIKATFAGNDLGYGTTEVAATKGTIDYNASEAKFDVIVTGDASHSIHTAGTAIPSKQSLTFASMVVQVDAAPWTLNKPASITYGSRLLITDFVLTNGSRRIALTGSLDRVGTQDLTLALDSVPILGFAEFVGFDGADGMLNGSIHLTGPAKNVAVEGEMDILLLGTRGKIVVAQAPDARHRVEASLTDSLNKTLRVTGTIPLSISFAAGDSTPFSGNGPLALTAKSDSFSVGWLTPFGRPYGITRIGGAIRADLQVAGTFADPSMSGTANLLGAHFDYPRHGLAYRNITGEFTLGGDRVHVTSLRIVSEGTADLTGDIVMETAAEPKLDLKARFERFRAARNEWTRLGITGDARLTGELFAPTMEGNVQLVDTDLFADPVGKATGTAVELTKEDFEMLEYYFGYDPTRIRQQVKSIIDPWSMNLRVTVGPDTWLRRRRSPQMAVQLEGSLDVRKAPSDSIQLFGNIRVLPERSYFQQFGRRFTVANGSVTFNGPMMQWMADFNARYNVPSARDPNAPEVTITLAVTGSLDNLHVTLGGDPQMETADVLSYLATGRPATSAAEFGGSDLADMGATVAASQLTSVIEDAASKSIGLDVVEIRHNGLKGATIVAGRYINPRFFIGFEQPLVLKNDRDEDSRRTVERTSEVQLEYRLYRWLLASLEGSQSTFSFLFRVRRAF